MSGGDGWNGRDPLLDFQQRQHSVPTIHDLLSPPLSPLPPLPSLPSPSPPHFFLFPRLSIPRFNLLLLSLSFMLLFTAFNTIQSYVTSLLPSHLGNLSLTVLYISVVVVVPVAPILVDRLGTKTAMILGAFCYCLYIASLIRINAVLVLISSAINGFGASILWVGCGDSLTRWSEADSRGANTGIFWGIFQLSSVIGNIAAYTIINQMEESALFTIFTLTACVGSGLLIFIQPLEEEEKGKEKNKEGENGLDGMRGEEEKEKEDRREGKGVNGLNVTGASSGVGGGGMRGIIGRLDGERIGGWGDGGGGIDQPVDQIHVASVDSSPSTSIPHTPTTTFYSPSLPPPALPHPPPHLSSQPPTSSSPSSSSPSSSSRPSISTLFSCLLSLFTTPSLLLLLPIFLFQGLEFSFWNGEFSQLFPSSKLGLVLLWAGVGECIGGISFGYLSDRIGRSFTLLLGSVLYAIALGITALVKSNANWAVKVEVDEVPMIGFAAALCFGLSDAAINTQIYAILGNKYNLQLQKVKKEEEEEDGPDRMSLFEPNGWNDPEVEADPIDRVSVLVSSSSSHLIFESHTVVAAFAAFNLLQNFGAAGGFYYQLVFPLHGDDGSWIQLYVQIVGVVVSTITFVCVDRNWWRMGEATRKIKCCQSRQ